MRRVLGSLVAVLAGVLLGLAWQPYALWPLLLVGVPALTLLARGIPLRRAFGRGYLFGLGMLGVTISWVHVLGWWVAAVLVLFMALYYGLLGVALSLVTRLRWWPVAAAACWVAAELAYSSFPFGGFGWTRLAYAAVDTSLNGWFPLVGVAGVSFLVALVGQTVAWLVLLVQERRPPVFPRVVPAALVIAALGVAGVGLRSFQVEPLAGREGSVEVGVVQGNVPGRGIEALGRARTVTNNHLSESVELMARARLGQVPEPDFLLWPENSTDIDPLLDPVTRQTVAGATAVAGVPILVGAVTQGPGEDERQTTALWWDPLRGVLATYHKRNLVPFGEWIPFRAQLLPLVPILREVGAQSVPGTEPGVLRVPLDGRTITVGDVICFELAYDDTVHEALTNGAQVLLVQSNNATYGGTGQIEQQFAITRVRAMEARREVAVATTNSVSGFIDRDGRVVQRTNEFTSAGFVEAMPLRTALTPAVLAGPWPARGLALLALVAVAVAVVRRRRDLHQNGHRPGPDAALSTPATSPTKEPIR
ncbi:apolipoprotein N-acyltransferase [Microlunatus sagamiharensis]|uniref:apolipoprotein N-acyltransferase n=1 Tax=Microlunatus sagamiharensis TaxID=546874 RepID=UPI0012FDDF9E|nr:apolipoprotein N-acyltransferase [Microlunatus sagamiharensis]